jgi:superfamily II DNA or RNA helicase
MEYPVVIKKKKDLTRKNNTKKRTNSTNISDKELSVRLESGNDFLTLESNEKEKKVDPVSDILDEPIVEEPVKRKKESDILDEPIVEEPVKKVKILKKQRGEQEITEEPKEQSKKRKPKCPNGSRRNRKTGKCEETVTKEVTQEQLDATISRQPEENVFIEPAKEDKSPIQDTALDDVVESQQKDPLQFSHPLIKDTETIIKNDLLNKVPKSTNEYLRQTEKIEYEVHKKPNATATFYDFLYPDLNDPDFAAKIAKRKEFNDFQYDGAIKDIEATADKLCKSTFELMPHQIFVKNFLSFQTPYNSLLLYHGLGSGKTCSSIGIAEEMRNYMKQVGIKQRIIVVASPNVQNNFRLQLFDERGLKEENGVWNLQSCIGNTLIKEINPTSLKGLSKEKVISQIRTIINQNYVFMGYTQLAHYISDKTGVSKDTPFPAEEQVKMEVRNIRRFFNNRLIIIDEVHNIRISDDNKDEKTATGLMKLAKHCENLRFVFLSATPMYNSYREIIWLTNLMNANDKRGTITEQEVFDKNGAFIQQKLDETGRVLNEGGAELLRRKLVGYISYIRGENPYTFPYRIYPTDFSPENTFIPAGNGSLVTQISGIITRPVNALKYPKIQLNSRQNDDPLKHVPVYLTQIGEYQAQAYKLIITALRKEIENSKMETLFENMDKFGFRKLQLPLEALNIVYPSTELDSGIAKGKMDDLGKDYLDSLGDLDEENEYIDESDPLGTIVGKRGMRSIMNFTDDSKKKVPMRYNFEYKPAVLETYGRVFSPEVLPTYSSKISKICNIIKASTGIVLIYSQYIDGGVVPLALALEEIGFSRYGSADYTKSLFKDPPVEALDSLTMKPRSELEPGANFRQAKYVMITGDKSFSPQNMADIKQVTSSDNKNGEIVKVVLISKAGSEGLDFKNIRQVHILEPWYNMNRIEQIIGRGVRNMSHCGLPFVQRNVEIYMHGTLMDSEEEAVDLYVYRLAERKSLQIGRVTRIMKEVAVDCLLNIGQTNFTVEKLVALAANQNITLTLSTGRKQLPYRIGDRPFTEICDYMDSCDFKCSSTADISPANVVKDTYSVDFLQTNNPRIMDRIRQLFRDQFFYKRIQLINAVNIVKQYPIEQIYSALSVFINNKSEFLIDRYGRRGNLINRGDVYAFQPVEINDESISVFERSVPIDYKRANVNLELPKEFPKDVAGPTELADILEEGKNEGNDYEENLDTKYNKLIAEIDDQMKNSVSKTKKGATDQDWFKEAALVVDHLQTTYHIGFIELQRHFLRHAIDMLMPAHKFILIKKLYSKIHDIKDPNSTEQKVKEYLDEKMISVGTRVGFVISDKNKWKIYLLETEEHGVKWKEADSEDVRQFEMSGALDKFKVDPKTFASMIGFINLFKSGKEMVFKTKEIGQMQNNTGTRIDSQIKANVVKRVNTIVDAPYSTEMARPISSKGFSIILEVLMRQMSDDKKGGKVWYMDPETAAVNGIEKYRI